MTGIKILTLMVFGCFLQFQIRAQNPVLKHSYTFEDGTAKDVVGDADGVMIGGKIEHGKYIASEQGQYIQLPAKQIKINTFTSLSLEAYIVAGGDNAYNTMLSYFGNTSGRYGVDYIFQSAKNQAISRTSISCNNYVQPWLSETECFANIPLDDGLPHYIVTTFDNKELRFYVDGLLVATQKSDSFPDNLLENLGDGVAYLGKSGYAGDATWQGSFEAFNIYDGILDAVTIERSAQAYLPQEVLAVRHALTNVVSADSLLRLNRDFQIDSLQNLINKSENEEQKVRWLNEYARLNFYNQNYETGFDATIQARELAKQIKFEGGEILYNYTLAACMKNDEVRVFYQQKATELARKTNIQESFTAPQIPNDYLGGWDKIRLDELLMAQKKYEKLGELEIQASIESLLMLGYGAQGHPLGETLKSFRKGVDLYKQLGYAYPTILYYNYLTTATEDNVKKEALKQEMLKYIKSLKGEDVLGPLNFQLAGSFRINGNPELAIKHYLNSIAYFESVKDSDMLTNVYYNMSILYRNLEMFPNQVEVNDKLISLFTQLKNYDALENIKSNAIWALWSTKQYDKARNLINSLLTDTTARNYHLHLAQKNDLEGLIATDKGQYAEAIPLFKKALVLYEQMHQDNVNWMHKHLALCYYYLGDYQTALKHALKSMSYEVYDSSSDYFNKEITLITSKIYEALGNQSEALKYLKKYQEVVDRMYSKEYKQGVFQTLMSSAIDESQEKINLLEQERALKEQQTKVQRLWIMSIAGALLSTLLILFMLYRNNLHRKKANTILQKQKQEIENQKKHVEETLSELRATQAQLIQSEKMASLGELTAGIAHEIQNPLNFVNNFSDLNSELIDEAKEELKQGNQDDVDQILDDIKENEQKISHHGKRAESIVKGMLQHSRTSSGEKELTDINALCDEYLRLSFHGLRAKHKNFHADFKLEADDQLPKIKVVPQDFGRVLLNLINNAFYAVNEKAKQAGENYKPMVTVSTKLTENKVDITVTDNGNGIPQNIKEKIFQPFFTTKPTGSGTGLGLSLSYDIVKAHGGELEVETEAGEGTSFTIKLKNT